jgi:ADP-ribose pyrophosphatase YjhB (NUDIX family)
MTIQSGSLKGTPFADFNHCPRCGAASLSKHDGRAVRCADCDFQFYFNCATSAAAFIFHQGKLLMGVRGKDPQQGMLDFPGGFVEFDETAEDALAREVHEELNVKLTSLAYLTSVPNDYWFAGVLYKTTDLYFVCEIEDISSLKAMDDVTGFLLAAPEDIEPRQLAFASGRIALQRLLEFLKPSAPG